jgi:hypothetical protein
MENEINAVVLNTKNELVSCAFPRFHSIYNPDSENIDWFSAIAEEKIDGVLVIVFNYKGNVFVQTRESIIASNLIPGTDESYRQAVERILSKKFDNPFSPFRVGDGSEDFVWVFEFVSPKNNTVIRYEEEDLVLLSIIKKSLGQVELHRGIVDAFAKGYNFTRPRKFVVRSEEEAVSFHNEVNFPYGPGIVISDRRGKRVKLVSNTFKTMEKLTNQYVSEKQIAYAALTGFGDRLSMRFGRFADLLLLFDTTIREIAEDADDFWSANYQLSSGKEFAGRVKDYSMRGLLFSIWSGKVENYSGVLSWLTPKNVIEETKKRHILSYREALKNFNETMEVNNNVRREGAC